MKGYPMRKAIHSLKKLDRKINRINSQNLNKIEELKKAQREEAKKIEHEVRKTTATSIASAFSFIIALFWRDAVQDLITKLLENLGLTNSSYIAKVIAAALVTVIGVIAIMRISKWGEIDKDKPAKSSKKK